MLLPFPPFDPISFPAFSTVYDGWVRHYNKAPSKPVALAEFVKARETMSDLYTDTQERLEWYEDVLENFWAQRPKGELTDLAFRMLEVVLARDEKPRGPGRRWYSIPIRSDTLTAPLNKLREQFIDSVLDEDGQVKQDAGEDVERRWNEAAQVAANIRSYLTNHARVASIGDAVYALIWLTWVTVDQGYPNTLPTWNKLSPKEREDIKPSGRRPKGYPSPVEIENAVAKLVAEGAPYVDEKGKAKPTPIRDRIVEDHPEWILGESDTPDAGIGESTMFRRVKHALRHLNMS